jgi:hypothetical protein
MIIDPPVSDLQQRSTWPLPPNDRFRRRPNTTVWVTPCRFRHVDRRKSGFAERILAPG